MAFRGSKRERGKRFHPHELECFYKSGVRHHSGATTHRKHSYRKEELNDGLRERKMEQRLTRLTLHYRVILIYTSSTNIPCVDKSHWKLYNMNEPV